MKDNDDRQKSQQGSLLYNRDQAEELLDLFPEANHLRILLTRLDNSIGSSFSSNGGRDKGYNDEVLKSFFHDTMEFLAQHMGGSQAVVQEFQIRRTKKSLDDVKAAAKATRKKVGVRFEDDEARALEYLESKALERVGIEKQILAKTSTSKDKVCTLSKGLLASTVEGQKHQQQSQPPQPRSRNNGGAGGNTSSRSSSERRSPPSCERSTNNLEQSGERDAPEACGPNEFKEVKTVSWKPEKIRTHKNSVSSAQEESSTSTRGETPKSPRNSSSIFRTPPRTRKSSAYDAVGTVAQQTTFGDITDVPNYSIEGGPEIEPSPDSYYFLNNRSKGSSHATDQQPTKQSKPELPSSLSRTPRYQRQSLRQQRPIQIDAPAMYLQAVSRTMSTTTSSSQQSTNPIDSWGRPIVGSTEHGQQSSSESAARPYKQNVTLNFLVERANLELSPNQVIDITSTGSSVDEDDALPEHSERRRSRHGHDTRSKERHAAIAYSQQSDDRNRSSENSRRPKQEMLRVSRGKALIDDSTAASSSKNSDRINSIKSSRIPTIPVALANSYLCSRSSYDTPIARSMSPDPPKDSNGNSNRGNPTKHNSRRASFADPKSVGALPTIGGSIGRHSNAPLSPSSHDPETMSQKMAAAGVTELGDQGSDSSDALKLSQQIAAMMQLRDHLSVMSDSLSHKLSAAAGTKLQLISDSLSHKLSAAAGTKLQLEEQNSKALSQKMVLEALGRTAKAKNQLEDTRTASSGHASSKNTMLGVSRDPPDAPQSIDAKSPSYENESMDGSENSIETLIRSIKVNAKLSLNDTKEFSRNDPPASKKRSGMSRKGADKEKERHQNNLMKKYLSSLMVNHSAALSPTDVAGAGKLSNSPDIGYDSFSFESSKAIAGHERPTDAGRASPSSSAAPNTRRIEATGGSKHNSRTQEVSPERDAEVTERKVSLNERQSRTNKPQPLFLKPRIQDAQESVDWRIADVGPTRRNSSIPTMSEPDIRQEPYSSDPTLSDPHNRREPSLGDETASRKEFLLTSKPTEKTNTTTGVVCSGIMERSHEVQSVKTSGTAVSSLSTPFINPFTKARKKEQISHPGTKSEKRAYYQSKGDLAYKTFQSAKHISATSSKSVGSCSTWETPVQDVMMKVTTETAYVRTSFHQNQHQHHQREQHPSLTYSTSDSTASTAIEDIIARCQQKLQIHHLPTILDLHRE